MDIGSNYVRSAYSNSGQYSRGENIESSIDFVGDKDFRFFHKSIDFVGLILANNDSVFTWLIHSCHHDGSFLSVFGMEF
jgi:hypothetical protein